MMNRVSRSAKLLHWAAFVVAVSPGTDRCGAASAASPEEIQRRNQWLSHYLSDSASRLPFSFNYGGQASALLVYKRHP